MTAEFSRIYLLYWVICHVRTCTDKSCPTAGLIYICSLVTTVCVTSPTNNLCYIIVGHNWLCDIVGEHHLGWFIYVRWAQLSVWHRRRTTSVILLLVTTGCVTSSENTIWVDLYVDVQPLGFSLLSVTTVYVTLLERTRWIYKQSQLSVWHSLYWATGLFHLYNCDCIIFTMSPGSDEEAALLPGSSVRRNHTYKSQVRAPGPVDIRGDDRK